MNKEEFNVVRTLVNRIDRWRVWGRFQREVAQRCDFFHEKADAGRTTRTLLIVSQNIEQYFEKSVSLGDLQEMF